MKEEKASYDDEGNIVIHGCLEAMQETPEPKKLPHAKSGATSSKLHLKTTVQEFRDKMQQVSLRATELSVMATREGIEQYAASFESAKRATRDAAQRLWPFLTQPVFVTGRRNTVNETNRLTLFILDTFRFGGTFAVIFGALFIGLNYESFWKIASTRLNPLQYAASVTTEADDITSALREKLQRNPALPTAGANQGDLLAFLPLIGPPENRIIIPKLGINAPLVTPSYDALLEEDWSALEKDIQEALEMGVVHYPGTARPGQAGNFFVTGHSSYYPWASGKYKTVFARVAELDVGDEYWVYYGGDRHRYIVTDEKEVRPSDVSVLDQPRGKRLSTLMTCTPVGTTLRRLILTAEEVDPVTGVALSVGEHEHRSEPHVRPQMLPI